MKKPLFLLIGLLLLGGCQDEEPDGLVCGKADPINELPWLKDKVALYADSSRGRPFPFRTVAYRYRRNTVLEVESVLSSSPYLHV